MNRARPGRTWTRLHVVTGVRTRLVATFVVAAALAAVAGIIVFAVVLDHALGVNVDQNLSTTAVAYANDIQNGALSDPDPIPVIRARARAPVRGRTVSAVAVVLDPAGRRAEMEPRALTGPLRRLLTVRSGPARRTVDVNGHRYRLLRERVTGPGGTWTVTVGQSLTEVEGAADDARTVLEALVLAAVLLAGVGAWLLSGAALRPVDRMRADAQRLADTGAPGAITVPGGGDSLTRLAQTFNTLLLRLHGSLERQRALVADAGHELRTPLAVLKTELQTAVRPGRSRADLEDSVARAEEETARLAALADDLLLLAQSDGRERTVHPERCDVAGLVERTAQAHAARYQSSDIELDVYRPEHPLDAEVDAAAVRRVLDNLLANAANYTPPGGAVELGVRAATVDGRPSVVITVDDTGMGFPVDFLPRAFERFARADQSRSRSGTTSGSGLGLAIVDALVRAHGGTVTARNREPAGARVEVVLPATAR